MIGSILFFVLSIMFLVLIVGITIYNGIIDAYNRVKQAWADVIVQERQKINILPKIESLLQEYKVFESDLQKSITAARSLMSELANSDKDFDFHKFKNLEEVYHAAKTTIMATSEAYPDLKSHVLYSSVMNEIVEQEENVGAAIRIYNGNATVFNIKIESFPDVLINNFILHKKTIILFQNDEVESTIKFNPNL